MFKIETKKVSRKVVTNVICNRCGKSCRDKKTDLNYRHAHVSVCWPYGSPKDGERHDWDLCEKCYDMVVKSFKYPPSHSDYLHDAPPLTQVHYPDTDWKRDSGQELKK